MNIPNIKAVGSLVTLTPIKGKVLSGKIIACDEQFVTIETINDSKIIVVSVAYIVYYEEYIPDVVESVAVPIETQDSNVVLDDGKPEAMGWVSLDKKGTYVLNIYGGPKNISIEPKVVIDDFSKGDNRVVFAKNNNKIVYVRKLNKYSKFLKDAETDENPIKAMAIVDMVLTLCPSNESAQALREKLVVKANSKRQVEESSKTFESLVKNEQYDNAIELFQEHLNNGIHLPFSLISRLYRKVCSDKYYKERLYSLFIDLEKLIDFKDVKFWLNLLLKSVDYDFLARCCNYYINSKNKEYKDAHLSVIYYYLAESCFYTKQIDKAEDHIQKSISLDCCNDRSVTFLCESIIGMKVIDLDEYTSVYTNCILNTQNRIVGAPNNWKENPTKAWQGIGAQLDDLDLFANYSVDPDLFISFVKVRMENYKLSSIADAKLYFTMAKYFYYKAVKDLIDRKDFEHIKDYCLASMEISKAVYNESFYEIILLFYIRVLIEERLNSDSIESIEDITDISFENTYNILSNENLDLDFWHELFRANIPDREELLLNLENTYNESLSSNGVDLKRLWSEYRQQFVTMSQRIAEIGTDDYHTQNEALIGIIKELSTPIFISDEFVIKVVENDILPELEQLRNSNELKQAKNAYENIIAEIDRMQKHIKNNSSLVLCGYIIPLLMKIKEFADKLYSFMKEQSTISLELSIESQTAIDNEEISIQLRTDATINSSSAKNIYISVKDSEYITCIEKRNDFCDGLNAGEHHISHLQLKLSEKAIKEKAVTICCICSYANIDNDVAEKEYNLSLELYSDEDFVPFENKFFKNSGTGLTEADIDMFYGREKDLNEVVTALESTRTCHYAIYGQMRSGKSSFMNILASRLNSTGKFFCIYWSLVEEDYTPNEHAFFYAILRKMKSLLTKFKGEKPEFKCPTKTAFCNSDDSARTLFLDYISDFKASCRLLPEWKDKKIVVMVDEFTALYQAIKLGKISNTFLQVWKSIAESEDACVSSVFCGHDTFPMWLDEGYATNAGRIFTPKRLDYLKRNDAVNLIVNPILDSNGNSRYTGNSVDLILEYTSCNPYYIQLFCKELVDTVLEKKSNRITEADVYAVSEKLINGQSEIFRGTKAFDNLISCGEAKSTTENKYVQEFPEEDILSLLRAIARNSTFDGVCKRSDIENVIPDSQLLDKYLSNLRAREVIDITYSEILKMDVIKIKVKLFSLWLQKN